MHLLEEDAFAYTSTVLHISADCYVAIWLLHYHSIYS